MWCNWVFGVCVCAPENIVSLFQKCAYSFKDLRTWIHKLEYSDRNQNVACKDLYVMIAGAS